MREAIESKVSGNDLSWIANWLRLNEIRIEKFLINSNKALEMCWKVGQIKSSSFAFIDLLCIYAHVRSSFTWMKFMILCFTQKKQSIKFFITLWLCTYWLTSLNLLDHCCRCISTQIELLTRSFHHRKSSTFVLLELLSCYCNAITN